MIHLNKNLRHGIRVLAVLICLFCCLQWVMAQSSTNYTVQRYVLDMGGNHSKSTSYRIVDAIGQPAVVSSSTSLSYKLFSGFLASPVYGTTDVDDALEMEIPTEFRLLQNYPNPFNPETTIEYHLPAVSDVVLTVYDVKGQQITRFEQNGIPAGVQTVQWDGRNQMGQTVATGIYIYRVEIMPQSSEHQAFTAMKKMTFMK